MRSTSAIVILALCVTLLLPGRARADCDDGGDCSGFAAAYISVAVVGALHSAMVVGGLVTMIGGAAHLDSHRWYVANVTFAALNLSGGAILCVLGGVGIFTPFALGIGAANLAVGGADLAVALVARKRQPPLRLSFAPLVGRDLGGGALSGLSATVRF